MPIPRFLTAELAGHIDGKRPDDLVFAGIRNGQPLRVSTSVPRSARRRGRSACPTCTRTSCGTPRPALAIASGADVKVVQQMLGHSSATMTLDTYGHLFEDRLDEVGDALDRAREAARQRRELLPRVAPVLSETDFHGNGEAAPTSVSAGQGRFSGSYPRPDSNRRYRLERGIEGSSDDVENQ